MSIEVGRKKPQNLRLAVIGLGYVGLPLAVEFSKKRQIVGFDISSRRIDELKRGVDSTLEVNDEEFRDATNILFTNNPMDLADSNCYIITVPTPIDNHKRPDLTSLLSASELVANFLQNGDIVIYESTVYPGCTEEDCVPVLEKYSGLRYNEDFYCGYSPERINPGDKEHRISTIKKVTSGSTQETAKIVDELYREIITAGTHRAENMKIAEAAKVIENTQRDLNIALVNELAILFARMNIDTNAVLNAASSKWNFLPFRPGLVGGHCIGVDPYYLTHKAQAVGYHPELVLAGRRVNDSMGKYIASNMVKLMINQYISIERANILVMGLTFKENCADLRNTRVLDLVNELAEYTCQVDIYDPWVTSEEVQREYDMNKASNLIQHDNNLVDFLAHESGLVPNHYDGIILAVAHEQFRNMGVLAIRKLGKINHILYDLKCMFPTELVDSHL